MPSTLSKDMLDPGTPPGVNVTDTSREPTPDPTLGIPHDGHPTAQGNHYFAKILTEAIAAWSGLAQPPQP